MREPQGTVQFRPPTPVSGPVLSGALFYDGNGFCFPTRLTQCHPSGSATRQEEAAKLGVDVAHEHQLAFECFAGHGNVKLPLRACNRPRLKKLLDENSVAGHAAR